MRRLSIAVLALILAALGGCTQDGVGQQARSGDGKGYVAGDGSVTEVPADKREAVQVKGTGMDGATIDTAQWRDRVVVLNVWYAACGPCRAEAPDLARIDTEFGPQGVQLLGLNTRDDAGTAQAFHRTFELKYPTVMDKDQASITALRGQVSPQAVPSTLVIDKQGRVSARVLGKADPSTLRTLIKTALAEPA